MSLPQKQSKTKCKRNSREKFPVVETKDVGPHAKCVIDRRNRKGEVSKLFPKILCVRDSNCRF